MKKNDSITLHITSWSDKFFRIAFLNFVNHPFNVQELQYAMRRAGQNPTDVEVQDLLNNIDNGSGTIDFEVSSRYRGEDLTGKKEGV